MASENSKTTVMIIEDDEATRQILALACEKRGFMPLQCASAEVALAGFPGTVSAIILDLGLPDIDGPTLLAKLLREAPWVPCFILTARDSSRTAVDCIRIGARDYFTKPVEMNRLFDAIKDATHENASTILQPPSQDDNHQAWPSEAGRECHSLALKAAATGKPLLITGASGTGRVTLARMIHVAGINRNGPLHILNAANPQDPDPETALFGKAGGIDGPPVRGLLDKCANGTLVICAVEKLPIQIQTQIEKAWASGRYRQKGSGASIKIACRLTCITSADLEVESASGRFSRKLWFALRNMHIRMPSLRYRIEDLPVFCARFLTEYCVANQTPRPEMPATIMDILLQHHWPGNLDELRHCIEHACKNAKGRIITASDLPRHLWDPASRVENDIPPVVGSARIDEVERASLVAALALCGGNRRLAAQRLGVSLRTIYNMIRRHQLAPKASKPKK